MSKGAGTTRSSSAANPIGIESPQGVKGINEYSPKGEYYNLYNTEYNSSQLIKEFGNIQDKIKETEEQASFYEDKAQQSKSKKYKPKYEQYAEEARNELKGLKNDLKDIKHILDKRGVTDEIIKASNGQGKSLKAFTSFNDKILTNYGIDLLVYS